MILLREPFTVPLRPRKIPAPLPQRRAPIGVCIKITRAPGAVVLENGEIGIRAPVPLLVSCVFGIPIGNKQHEDPEPLELRRLHKRIVGPCPALPGEKSGGVASQLKTPIHERTVVADTIACTLQTVCAFNASLPHKILGLRVVSASPYQACAKRARILREIGRAHV